MSLLKHKDLLIIIPAYNESKNIGALLEKMSDEGLRDMADLLIINDGSTDDTSYIAKGMGVRVIDQIYNMGYGCALWTGYKYATVLGYKYLIQMDADGQHDTSNIMALYDRIRVGDADIVIGSRFVPGAGEYHMSGIRRFAVKLFSWIIKLGTGKVINDPTSGLQAMTDDVFGFYSQYGNFDDRYPDANMLMQMLLLGYRVEETAAVMHSRVSGRAMHSGLKPVLYMMRMTLSLITVWWRIRVYKRDIRRKKQRK